ncbi:MAG: alpha/beta fold hydrolase [Gammaproteobacteria bacterium]|nr:alpha/beta fold hydrolase [Gammaproteobacteria bacterium]
MRKAINLAALLLVLPAAALAENVERVEKGALVMEGIPDIPEETLDRLRQYNNVRGASLRGWTPDGGIMIGTRFGSTTQLHRVDEPMGVRHQLTFYDEPVGGGSYADEGPWRHGFLFTRDFGGNEQNQIFFFDTRNGQERLLTDGESRNSGYTWSNDGKRFAFTSNRDDGTNQDIWVATPEGPESARMVAEVDGAFWVMDWSPDDTKLLVIRYVSINEAYIYEVDVASGEMTEINPTDQRVGYGGGAYGVNGDYIYLVSDQGSEFKRLHRLDRETGELVTLTGDIDWDINGFAQSDDGEYIAFAANENGMERLWLHEVDDGEHERVEGVPVGQIGGFGFDQESERLAVTFAPSDDATDVHIYDIDDEEFTRWTQSEIGGLNADTFVTAELVHYPTFDEVDGQARKIPAFVYKPEGEPRGGDKHPVVVYIHGGPESQYRPSFSSTFQFLINELGVAIVAPNVRGSAGYGKSYLQLDNGFKREDSVKDIGALLDWLETRDDLDADRAIVYGGSYGGYMVLASMMHYDERLLGGIDVVGISNFVTFLKNTKAYRRDLRRAEYGDERDPEMYDFLQEISPANHADEFDKPLLVIQGANDPRVPLSESEQMVAEMRDSGNEVWYLMAKNEGHGFRKKDNREAYLATVALFIDELLERD